MQPSIQRLLASWHATPAFVRGRYMDILAANPLAIALSPLYEPGVNVLRIVFLDRAVHRFHHPQVGELELRCDKFDIAGTDGQRLVIYQAEPASTSEQALSLLASIAYDRIDASVRNVNAM